MLDALGVYIFVEISVNDVKPRSGHAMGPINARGEDLHLSSCQGNFRWVVPIAHGHRGMMY